MIMKLRNQLYAPKWEQEEREKKSLPIQHYQTSLPNLVETF
jgi:hypothetical protein